ncbi:hypothetical protein GF420_15700 [candidate division GN15 bacterium]|nr:hypothetical protein [candidate division GN15 bacterium]
MYGYDIKGSPADSGEDDVWTGSPDFSYPTIKDAKHSAEVHCNRPSYKNGAAALHILITKKAPSPNPEYFDHAVEVVEEYCYKEANMKKKRQEERAERQEKAMQAGMAFGCAGYNQFYGELTGPPDDALIRGPGGRDAHISWGPGEFDYAEEKAYEEGMEAAEQGLSVYSCPFKKDLVEAWKEGYHCERELKMFAEGEKAAEIILNYKEDYNFAKLKLKQALEHRMVKKDAESWAEGFLTALEKSNS